MGVLLCLPSGCDVVLEWLRRTYWSRQLGNSLAGECEEEQNGEVEAAATEAEVDSDTEEAQNPQPPGYQKHKELHGGCLGNSDRGIKVRSLSSSSSWELKEHTSTAATAT